MTPEKKAIVEELAGIAHDKRIIVEAWSMANSNVPPEQRRAQAIAYALARAESLEAEDALKKAMQS